VKEWWKFQQKQLFYRTVKHAFLVKHIHIIDNIIFTLRTGRWRWRRVALGGEADIMAVTVAAVAPGGEADMMAVAAVAGG